MLSLIPVLSNINTNCQGLRLNCPLVHVKSLAFSFPSGKKANSGPMLLCFQIITKVINCNVKTGAKVRVYICCCFISNE